VSLLLKLLEQLEPDFDNAICEEEKDDIIEFAIILLLGFLLDLRGEEIMKTDIDIADSDGLRRLFRRDSTMEAGNLKIDEKVVNLKNR